jgi:hypothetical protein
MSEPDSSPPSLQFERAELEEAAGQEARGVQCAFCQTPFLTTYFDINGQTACQVCRVTVEADFQTRPGLAGFLRALAAGFGAALAGGGIYYAVLALTDYEFSLISILVGFLVGNAVRWGARGKGGWVYQTLAIFLTYMAIVSTYIPLMVKSLAEDAESKETAAVSAPAPTQAGLQPAAARAGAAAPSGNAGAEAPPATAAEEGFTFGQALLAIVALFAFAAALPFLAGFENILGLLIIGFGLWEAWRMNKRAKLEILGPYTAGAAPPEPPAPLG